jgi:uncharacterized protein
MEAFHRGRFQMLTSTSLLDELVGVLLRPRIRRRGRFAVEEIAALRVLLERKARVVPGTYEVDLVPRDPKDNPVVACALEGGAPFIVTNDRRDLLALKVILVAGHPAIQIVQPAPFLRLLGIR